MEEEELPELSAISEPQFGSRAAERTDLLVVFSSFFLLFLFDCLSALQNFLLPEKNLWIKHLHQQEQNAHIHISEIMIFFLLQATEKI